jgi:hypothetical protein
MVGEIVGAVRRALAAGGWGPVSSAAALGFLAVLGVGAAFVAVLKIYDPAFGIGRDPLWVVVRIVISGLASLGIPIEQVGASGAILPLGGLTFVALVTVWAARNVVGKSSASSAIERMAQGAKTGVPFALLVFAAAIVFRVQEPAEVGAVPGAAVLIGGLWGSLFGAIGGALAKNHHRALTSVVEGVDRYRATREGVVSGAIMLLAGAALACATTLIILIANLAVGSGVALSWGDALAIVFLLLAFAPNLTVGTLALTIGGPVTFVAESLGVGVERTFSLLGWGAEGPHWYLYPLLLIPLSVCLFGGYVARRKTADPSRYLEIIGIAAASFGGLLAVGAYLGGVSLDRVFLGEGNLLVLRAAPGPAFFFGALWAAAAGTIGWKLAESQSSSRPSVETEK